MRPSGEAGRRGETSGLSSLSPARSRRTSLTRSRMAVPRHAVRRSAEDEHGTRNFNRGVGWGQMHCHCICRLWRKSGLVVARAEEATVCAADTSQNGRVLTIAVLALPRHTGASALQTSKGKRVIALMLGEEISRANALVEWCHSDRPGRDRCRRPRSEDVLPGAGAQPMPLRLPDLAAGTRSARWTSRGAEMRLHTASFSRSVPEVHVTPRRNPDLPVLRAVSRRSRRKSQEHRQDPGDGRH